MEAVYVPRVPEEESKLHSKNEFNESLPVHSTTYDSTYDYRPERTIGEIRRFDGKKWLRKELKLKSDSTREFKLQLYRGGAIKVHVNMTNAFDQIEVEEELTKHPELFREYPIQGGREPRANLFFHEKATKGETEQPGYKYRSTRMKAISYKGFPSLKRVSKQTAKHCSVPYWNIGVNAVCYRDGNDSIGYHADNDQGEDTILSKFRCNIRLCGYSIVVTLVEASYCNNALIFPIASSLLDIFPTNTTPSQNSGGTKGKVCTGYRRRRYLAAVASW
jgi:alkylated DNA repair dioxygenase AlkB